MYKLCLVVPPNVQAACEQQKGREHAACCRPGPVRWQETLCTFSIFHIYVSRDVRYFSEGIPALEAMKNPSQPTENLMTLNLCLANNFCHYHLFSEISTLTLFRRNTRKVSPETLNVIMLVRKAGEASLLLLDIPHQEPAVQRHTKQQFWLCINLP